MTANIDHRLQSEIHNLLRYVERLRVEVAGAAHREDDSSAFDNMSDQLDAIVASTLEATDTILEAVEAISADADKLRAEGEAEQRGKLCDQITDNAMRAMEACGFQDLTGQRVSKIVRSMKFIEERVNAMAELWGTRELEKVGDEIAKQENPMDGEVSLEGPQLPGGTISQDEIDKLFS